MALIGTDLTDNVVSVVQTTGMFDSVNSHELKSAPRNGLTASVWLEGVSPVANRSDLTNVTVRVEFYIRLYQNMLSEPQDAIDPNLLDALSKVMAAFAEQFTLQGSVLAVDLLGLAGAPLSSHAGYTKMDGKLFRIIDIICPIIVDDAWTEVA